jgi:hypothetical protein
MAAHSDPSFRPGIGQTRHVVFLTDDAEWALEIWARIYGYRCDKAVGRDATPTVTRDAIDNVLAEEDGTLRGHLLLTAVTDADTRPTVAPGLSMLVEQWAVVQMLAETSRTIAPSPVLSVDYSTTCRHGVPYSDDCKACDDEIGD